jgi:protein TonB
VQETETVVATGQPRRALSPSVSSGERISVGGNVQATRLVKKVSPAYPASAMAQGIEGTVLLNAVIGKDGHLISTKVLNRLADPDLAAAALDAVKQWQYEPSLLNGVPVEVVTTITINFKLQ